MTESAVPESDGRRGTDLTEKIEAAKLALAKAEALWGADHVEITAYLDTLGALLKVEPIYRRSLDIRFRSLGPGHETLAPSLKFLAHKYRYIRELGNAYQMELQTLGMEDAGVLMKLRDVGAAYARNNKYGDAMRVCQRVLAIAQTAYPADSREVRTCMRNAAQSFVLGGQWEQSVPLYQQLLATIEMMDVDFAAALDALAKVFVDQKMDAQAEPLYRQLLSIQEQLNGPDHALAMSARSSLGKVYKAQGKLEQAEELYSERSEERRVGKEC
jgi:tetratricopeptide (TPR) repeat protein